jgi:hypothetical protein
LNINRSSLTNLADHADYILRDSFGNLAIFRRDPPRLIFGEQLGG